MRVTSSMYYKSLYGSNNNQLQTKLFDVNKQIASGIKIQYASEDIAAFTETMRLDNEITTLQQIKKSTESGYKVSNQTDVVLNEFETSMNRMRTLLLSAANGTNDATSLDSIASELRGIEGHFKNLANTSINGQYLFSGSAVDIKPISEDGTYNGNDANMDAFLGSRSKQQYNISGSELFLGEEILTRREITTNVVQSLNAPNGNESLSGSSTMSEFMGDSPDDNHYFYINGVKSDGSAFAKKIPMIDSETVDDLLDKIGNAYGNTASLKLVNISMNDSGHITVADKITGSSKLDFSIVGATDFANTGAANVNNIDNLDTGETNYSLASATPELYIREFVKSGFTQADSVSTAVGENNIEGLLSDRTEFGINGNLISSNISQINKETNAFATPSTKISEVADITKGTLDTSDDSLDGTEFNFTGTTTSGAAYDVDINFDTAGSTFTINGDEYDIFNIANPRVATPADDVTYQQLMDVMNMVVTGNLPALHNGTGNDALEVEAYDDAIYSSNFSGETSLSHDGKIRFFDLSLQNTQATMALHDINSGNFNETIDSNGSGIDYALTSVMSFNSNNALTVRDPKTDFFKTIDEMITAVENHKLYPDSLTGEMRNVGIENAISMMDDIQDHIFRSHSLVGANSNTLTASLERTEILEISTRTLRSSVIDTDLAEASLELTQLTLNYEAMLSTVGRISKLSLVNYL